MTDVTQVGWAEGAPTLPTARITADGFAQRTSQKRKWVSKNEKRWWVFFFFTLAFKYL